MVFLTFFAGSVPLTSGSGAGSRKAKNIWIGRIRIRVRNTACSSMFFLINTGNTSAEICERQQGKKSAINSFLTISATGGLIQVYFLFTSIVHLILFYLHTKNLSHKPISEICTVRVGNERLSKFYKAELPTLFY
jgi:hypothetical protein